MLIGLVWTEPGALTFSAFLSQLLVKGLAVDERPAHGVCLIDSLKLVSVESRVVGWLVSCNGDRCFIARQQERLMGINCIVFKGLCTLTILVL